VVLDLNGSKGLYAAVIGVDHMQQGKRDIAGSARVSKLPDSYMANENVGFNSL
jgi:hypothetical protein